MYIKKLATAATSNVLSKCIGQGIDAANAPIDATPATGRLSANQPVKSVSHTESIAAARIPTAMAVLYCPALTIRVANAASVATLICSSRSTYTADPQRPT